MLEDLLGADQNARARFEEKFPGVRCSLCGRIGLHFCVEQAKRDRLQKMRQEMWEKAVLAGRTVEEADAVVKAYEERFGDRWTDNPLFRGR